MGVPTAMNMSQPPMHTDLDILTLQQWLSPAFPVGAFAYSHGLETAIQQGQVGSAETLETWLSDILAHGSGRNDAVLLRGAYGANDAAALEAVDTAARAFAASAERVRETSLQGEAFCATTQAIWGGAQTSLCFSVAVGAAAARRGIDLSLTVAMYLQAFASTLVSAAVRLVPLGQTDGQRVLATLTPLCHEIAQETRNAGVGDLHSTAFLSDITAMTHETLSHRIFRS